MAGDTFALAYQHTDDPFTSAENRLSTFTIPSSGTTITQVQTLTHDSGALARQTRPSMVQVAGNTYALAYAGPDTDGFLKTFTVSSDGTTITEVQSLEHDTFHGDYHSLLQLSTGDFALAYTCRVGSIVEDDACLKTFTISSDGSTITETASLTHQDIFNNFSHSNALVEVNADLFALAYGVSTNKGAQIKTFGGFGGTDIAPVPAASLYWPTDVATVNIDLSNATDLLGVGGKLAYDDSRLTYDDPSLAAGAFLDDGSTILFEDDDAAGTASFSVTRTSGSGATGDGTAATVTLTVDDESPG